MAQSANKRTYYKRALPSPPAIAFSSAEGREIFAEALQHGTMVGFFKLIEQFTTQEEPQYCGLAALSMTLNALGIDPRRTWKGAWRWFSETMLDCCKTMEDIKRDGITLSQAACLARCNGADVSVHRHGTFEGTTFRQLLRDVTASEDRHMVVSYSRKVFKQSGDGHFSPIGGFHPGRDLVLILDVARFKYSPHWVRVDELIEAMGLLDPAIGRPRGFLLMSSRNPRESALFSLDLEPGLGAEQGCGLGADQGLGQRLSADDAKPGTASAGDGIGGGATDAGVVDGLVSEQVEPGPVSEPRWAAACRFVTRDAGELIRRLLTERPPPGREGAGAAAPGAEAGGDEGHEEGHEEDEAEGAEDARGGGGDAGTAGGGGGGVPSLEALVAELVAAAPLESVCVLLSRRPLPGRVGEVRSGPCCSCPLSGPREVAGAGTAQSVSGATAPGAAASAVPPSPFGLAPCNTSHGRCRSGGQAQSASHSLPPPPQQQQQQLTEAAVAAVQVAAAAADGSSVCRAASQPPRSPLQPPPAAPCKTGDGGGGVNAAANAAAQCAAAATAAGSLAATASCSGSIYGSSASLSSRSDAASLDSAGPSDSSSFMGSLGSSHGSSHGCCSGASAASSSRGNGGSSGGSSGGGAADADSCCHGEPLEHHCVPPPVQALVADELRFTNMFKLVDYCLRRRRGCSHVRQPDLTAFMSPAGAAAAAAAAATAANATSTTTGPKPASETGPSTGAGACSPPAVAAAVAAADAVATVTAAGAAQAAMDVAACPAPSPALPRAADAGGGAGAVRVSSAGNDGAGAAGGGAGGTGAGGGACGCDLGLPELASEKLAVALLLLSDADVWPEVMQGPAQAQGEGGSGATAGVRVCGRPRCRKCRQRAAAAGDRAAALELLRERWRQLLGLAPLGLFASSAVLADELSFLRLQLTCADQKQ